MPLAMTEDMPSATRKKFAAKAVRDILGSGWAGLWENVGDMGWLWIDSEIFTLIWEERMSASKREINYLIEGKIQLPRSHTHPIFESVWHEPWSSRQTTLSYTFFFEQRGRAVNRMTDDRHRIGFPIYMQGVPPNSHPMLPWNQMQHEENLQKRRENRIYINREKYMQHPDLPKPEIM